MAILKIKNVADPLGINH
ncbi:Protein of unknown function [Lactobacillus acidophilus DSM 9126]|nr:Protein of unknown function [Lactobacillus acidophilus DSM 20079 = JCM 1132 = NBRC 13951 = CIP 76.13]CDF69555.1 Protein of unknown function [Lactobacillus acidophilus CIRM-BIA 442]CDF71351.1 Protein of unknown function [Lactobacillus acidophilus CIRM-BIA 445]CDF73181.1 Protein of unknown function [Lactobacillus acidophilus DSM 9126]CDF75170.1 Protein of unknown function [Lactobacillus acidophilus DSM 20242]